jgi:tetratricopeptide (TPR) repeat protein
VLYVEGDFAGALRQYTRGLELEADHAWVHRQIAMAHEAQGKYTDALGSLTKAEVGSPRKADLNAIRASVYALAGQRNEASRLLADIERVAEREPVAGAEMALAYFALDEPDRAYYWLDRAIAARENDVQYLAVDPRYRFVRQQQGFQQRLRKLGLPQEAGR